MCFTNHGEALYMMSSSELQRISVSATKVVDLDGTIDLHPMNETEQDYEDDVVDVEQTKSELEVISEEEATKPLSIAIDSAQNGTGENLTNGVESSPNNANDTITSSVGDMTIDSVRDHLNSTVTTIHSTTTEEIVGE